MAQNSSIRVCFLGDSLVNGSGDETFIGWTGAVCQKAVAKGLDITQYNLGIRGNTSLDVLNRWKDETNRRYKEGSDLRVVLSFGTNDTLIEEEGNPEQKMRLETEQSLSTAKQLFSEVKQHYKTIYVAPFPCCDSAHNSRAEKLGIAMCELAENAGIPVINIFNELLASEDWNNGLNTGDGYHPKSVGYQKAAHFIEQHNSWWF